MTDQESEKTYSSGEAAKKLGISVQSLKRRRLLGQIKGKRVGETNVYVYTEQQLREADLTPKKPGPSGGPRKKGDGDAAGHRWDSCLPAPMLARVG
jgi:hypothetical protein